jgi:anti-sigma B factor antagonist
LNLEFRTEIDRLDDGVVAISLFGELDQATVATLREGVDPLVDAGDESVLVDLSGCAFIDSSGLAAFVGIRDRVIAREGRGFAVCCPDSQVRRLLELTGLDEAMGLTVSRDEAIAALRDGVSPKPA